MRNFSYVSDVAEGDFATFSCTIEKYSGNILWRVGAHTVQCCGGDTVALPGSGTNINCTVSEGEADVVEVMGIEATPGLDGAPVECVLESFEGRSHNEFSQFVIIHVISLPPSPLASSGDHYGQRG